MLFIYGFGWGIAGSAWATVVSQAGMGAAFVTALLRSPMLAASLALFMPVALGSLALDLGIVGVWCGLLGLIGARLATCGWRLRGRRWAIVGATRARA